MSEVQGKPSRWSSARWLLAVFLLFALAVGAAGYFFFQRRSEAARQRAHAILKTIAELKVEEIRAWRAERMDDAAAIAGNPLICEAAARVIEGTADPATREKVRQWLASLRAYPGFRSLSLVDHQGRECLSAGEPGERELSAIARRALEEVLASGRPAFLDLHAAHEVSFLHMGILVPIATIEQGGPVGAIIVRIDPAASLYPILASWPLPTQSGETLLVRREGDSIVFLSPLRFARDAPLGLRRPLNTPDLPAAKAARGLKGGQEGRDYAGRQVLAVVRDVPGSPWFIVAKADRSELLARLHKDAWGIFLMVLLLILATGGVMTALWRQERVSALRREVSAERERNALVKHFEHLVKYANDIILLADAGGRYIEVNDAALRAYGYSREEMLGLTIESTRAPQARKDLPDTLRQLHAAGEAGIRFETLHKRKDGSVFPVEISARCIEVEGRKYYQSIVRDITERVQAEEALRESEDKFKYVFASSLLGKSITRVSGEMEVNQAFCGMLGYSREEMLRLKWQEITYPEDVEDSQRHIDSLLAGERDGVRFVKRYLHKNGSVVWADVGTAVRRDAQGRPLYFMTSVNDITERKRAEEDLRKSEAELHAVLDATPFPVALVDLSDENILMWSRSALELFGHTAPTVKEWYEIAYPDPEYRREVIDRWKAALAEARPSGKTVNAGEYRVSCRGGSYRLCELYATFLENHLLVTFNNVTERKRAEEERSWLQDLMASSLNEIFVFDAETLRFTYANRGACFNLGYSVEELGHLTPVDIKPEFTEETFRAAIQPLVTGEQQILVFETVHRRKDGSTYPVDIHLQLMRTQEGAVFLAVINDITERKRAQEELAIQARIAAIFVSVPDDEMFNEVLNLILEVMSSPFGVFGYLDEDGANVVPTMTRQIWDKCQVPDKSIRFPRETWGDSTWPRAILEKRTIVSNEPSSNIPAGHVGVQRHISMPILFQGEAIGLFQVANKEKEYTAADTAKLEAIAAHVAPLLSSRLRRERAQEVLRDTKEHLENLIGTANAPIIVWDAEGHITRFNRAFEEIAGRKAEAVLGRSLEFLFPDNQRAASMAIVARAGSGERFELVEVPILHASGSQRTVLWNSAPVLGSDGKTQVATIAQGQDITERKLAEEDLALRAEDLARSNAELQQFAYVASHDLQEPLRVVASYVQLLSRRYKGKLDAEADEFIEFAVDGAKRMQQLINDLLHYSRVGTKGGVFLTIKSEKALDEALANMDLALREAGAEVTRGTLPTVRADQKQIVQLFQNLVSNAVKFRGTQPPRIHVEAQSSGKEWVFSVKDNGIGIEPRFFDRIFIIFQRLHGKAEFPGTGIGLAICQKIVERHKGKIWVESNQGAGSTFFFTLPKG